MYVISTFVKVYFVGKPSHKGSVTFAIKGILIYNESAGGDKCENV